MYGTDVNTFCGKLIFAVFKADRRTDEFRIGLDDGFVGLNGQLRDKMGEPLLLFRHRAMKIRLGEVASQRYTEVRVSRGGVCVGRG